jgi:SAM-dependent methyltransferase
VDRLEVRGKWQGPAAGERYASARWSSERRRQRDPRRVAALLARHLGAGEAAWILDAPCGTGRLRAALAPHGRALGLDASPAMLAEARARAGSGAPLVAGDVLRLPFRDASFEAVVCCRLLHHLEHDADFERALGELVRVSRRLVIASFWDADSLPAWRRALFPGGRAPRRHARRRADVAAALARAGAEVAGWSASLRFVSRQTFVVARKRARA